MNPNSPFERDLERWLEAEAPNSAPAGLHAAVIDRARTVRQRPGWAASLPGRRLGRGRGRGLTLFAVAALLLVGSAMAAGSGLVLLLSPVPPQPAPSLAAITATPSPALESPSPTASARPAPTAKPASVVARAPSWTPTAPMTAPRTRFAAVPLHDGKVLVVGGPALASAELYDPATGTWTATGSMVSHAGPGAGYYSFTATLLRDGRVLVAGGGGSAPGRYSAAAELYDPATGTWTATGSMLTPRASHSATLLLDGRVLVAGGQPDSPVASAELYDPATGTWTATGSMGTVRASHSATLLSDGRVLVAGGMWSSEPMSSSLLSSAELYDPAAGTWAYTRSMVSAYAVDPPYGLPVLLADGRVLLGHGQPQLYDPGTRSWTATGGNVVTDLSGPDVLLANGGVLAVGVIKPGEAGPPTTAAYLFDPGAGTWTAVDALRGQLPATATLLPDGRVLALGGSPATNQAELFDPGTWSPDPAETAAPAPSPTPYAAQPAGSTFAYLQGGRLWVANRDGTGAHELLPDLVGNPRSLAWSPDGTRLVFSMTADGAPDGVSRLYLTDATGSQPQLVATGCVAPCHGDSDAAFSSDGTRLVFVRTITGAGSVLATVDLTTGQVAELASTAVSDASGKFQGFTPANYHPRWSPDGTRIVFTQDVPNAVRGKVSSVGPLPAVFVVDADGRNLREVGPRVAPGVMTADWSPDGARIVFGSESFPGALWYYDIYTVRPDGTGLRRLTSDHISLNPSWTADGRIGFIQTHNGLVVQLLIMNADGGNVTRLGVPPQFENAGPISWPPKP
jgi:Tol biopolymer transport system component